MKGPSFSLRDVPWTIYVALALNLLGMILLFAVTLTASKGASYETYERWFAINGAIDGVFYLMLPLGLMELAKRQHGSARTLGLLAASMLFAGMLYLVVSLGVAIVEPKEYPRAFWEWFGRFQLLLAFAGYLLLTLAADAWRRVPLAAVGIMLAVLTNYAVPVIGPAISEWLKPADRNLAPRYLYGLIRESISCVSLLFLAGALAARGHVIPAPARARAGFQLARGALLARLVAAVVFILFALAATKSPGAAKLISVGIPAVAVVTAILYSIGMVQVASSQVAHMPRALFAIGAACVLWWTFFQSEQLETLITALRDRDTYFDRQRLDAFSIIGPIIAAIGMLLPAIAIHSYASRSGATQLVSQVAGRIAGFCMLTVVALLLQSGIVTVKSAGGAVMLLLAIAATNIGALLTYTGMLAQAAYSIERPAELPTARLL